MVRNIVVALSLQIGMNVCFLHEVRLQSVDVLRTLHVIDDQFWVLFADTSLLEEVLHLDQVHAHLDHFLHEGLLALREEVLSSLLVATKRSLLCKLLLDAVPAGLIGRHWSDTLLLHEV